MSAIQGAGGGFNCRYGKRPIHHSLLATLELGLISVIRHAEDVPTG